MVVCYKCNINIGTTNWGRYRCEPVNGNTVYFQSLTNLTNGKSIAIAGALLEVRIYKRDLLDIHQLSFVVTSLARYAMVLRGNQRLELALVLQSSDIGAPWERMNDPVICSSIEQAYLQHVSGLGIIVSGVVQE